ncbi:thermonuclease family protein [Mesomycoplasma hyorhinis]|uniref:thermonuclease family protein n=1 Tax=Mesomycoplasma hyorhinis TaxID=2100 RepID=UPI0027E018DA|nr:thermonuclease family protein [Mesomycoplasma hyorhinis]
MILKHWKVFFLLLFSTLATTFISCQPNNNLVLDNIKNEKELLSKLELPEQTIIVKKTTRLQVSHSYLFKIKNNYDGDTFKDIFDNKIRLFGVDTPEIEPKNNTRFINIKRANYYARKAKEFSANLLQKWSNLAYATIVEKDPYDRYVAKVRIQKQDLASELLKNGLAVLRYFQVDKPKKKYYYPNHKELYTDYKNLQNEAKDKKINVWSENTKSIYGINLQYISKKY